MAFKSTKSRKTFSNARVTVKNVTGYLEVYSLLPGSNLEVHGPGTVVFDETNVSPVEVAIYGDVDVINRSSGNVHVVYRSV